jgi:hypothetical protein
MTVFMRYENRHKESRWTKWLRYSDCMIERQFRTSRSSGADDGRFWGKGAACILAVSLTAIDGATRTLQSLRPSFSVGWNLLVASYSY